MLEDIRKMAVFAVFAMGTGCGGGGVRPPPTWFEKPPQPSSQARFFVGDASEAPDPGSARDLAIQKAIANLTQFCGAVVKSDFQSFESESNGRVEQSVSLTVDVSGEELTLREVVVQEAVVRKSARSGYDAFALVRWPISQYRAVLAMQKRRAQGALGAYLQAESSFKEARIAKARMHLNDAKRVLGPSRVQVELDHPRIGHTGLLEVSMASLEERLTAFEANRAKIVAVGVDCSQGPSKNACPAHRVGRLREQVIARGLEVSSTALPRDVARQVAEARSPVLNPELRASGYVLAVTYDAQSLGEDDDGFVYARCGARAVLFEMKSEKIFQAKDVAGEKAGHIHLDGAIKLGCSETESSVIAWLDGALQTIAEREK